jgi:NAD-dependent histone deacetylase SIR2
MCANAEPTETHKFLKELIEEKRIIRWYTQNIDGLEGRVGLETSIDVKIEATCEVQSSNKAQSKNPPVIGLHGTLERLSCTVCKTTVAYEQHEIMKSGKSPDCGNCTERIETRKKNGQRSIRGGVLRPDIVLYNEPNPQGDTIAEHVSADIAKRPILLLVIGTSLKVVGLKRLIKDIAKTIHVNSDDGMVVYLNKTGIQAKSEWKSIFDYELVGECDRWVSLFRDHFVKVSTSSKRSNSIISMTPCKPAVKNTTEKKTEPKPNARIETFFKHAKSIPTTKSKKLAKETDINKENVKAPLQRTSSRLRALSGSH